MPTHDSYLRLTPLERLLPDDDFAARHFDDIRTEAANRGVSLLEPGAFAMLDATGRAVDDLRRVEDGAEQRHQHALLLFHAFHMLQGESPLNELVSTEVVRWLVEMGEGVGEAPTAAADAASAARNVLAPGQPSSRYVQLPQHLVWVREDGEERPASLDGFFCTTDGEKVVLLGVTGVTGPGQGFSVMPLPPLPLADSPIWLSEKMREEGEDFRSTIPGAELEGLYEVTNAGELLKLVARLDRYQQAFPDGRRTLGSPDTAPDASTFAPIPSRLPATLLTLD